MACIGDDLVEDLLPLEIKDPDWIPVVAGLGWVAITKNYRIRTQPVEAQLAIDSGLVAVCVFPFDEEASRWELSEILFRHWKSVEGLDPADGPSWLELTDDRAVSRDYEPGMSNRRLRRSRRKKT